MFAALALAAVGCLVFVSRSARALGWGLGETWPRFAHFDPDACASRLTFFRVLRTEKWDRFARNSGIEC
jgi:hypothetical protein